LVLSADRLAVESDRDRCVGFHPHRSGAGSRSVGGWPTRRLLLETSGAGVFAAGDVRADSVKRVASAVGEGAMAIHFVHEYLKTCRVYNK